MSVSSDAIAGLIGAAIGALATLVIGLIARLWASQDARTLSRQKYVEAAAARLQEMVATPSDVKLRQLHHEMFQLALMGAYIPRGEGAVHGWYVQQDIRLLQMAIDSFNHDQELQGAIFSESVDVLDALRGWSRREWDRRRLWFWWDLHVTHRDDWLKMKAANDRAKAARAEAQKAAKDTRKASSSK